MKNALIIGGTSGLGLELGKQLKNDYKVIATGRRLPEYDGIDFIKLDLAKFDRGNIDEFIKSLPKIDLLCVAAGYFQDGTVTDLSDEDVCEMVNVGLTVPIIIIKDILCKQSKIPLFIPITSTSQWTPRLREPIYTAVKGGFGMISNSLSLDPRVKKTLLVGPAGMKTRFWENSSMDQEKFLDPEWVAKKIIDELKGDYSYKFIKIMRDPARVELAELRK